jgi:magnesium-transporting ATPase (P-type)
MISLIIAATVYLFFTLFEPKASAWMEVLTIYGGVVLATLLSAYSEYKQEKQFLKIKDEINNTTVTVYRG